MKLYDVLGWVGVVMILVAYTLNVLGLVETAHYMYLSLNAFGAIGLIISSHQKKDFQPVLLNSIWLIIALVGIAQVLV